MLYSAFIPPAVTIKADKVKSTEKTDGAVAASMALDRAIQCCMHFAYYPASLAALGHFAENRVPHYFLNAKTLSGDGSERCRWHIQRSGGRESYEQSRGHLCRRRVRR